MIEDRRKMLRALVDAAEAVYGSDALTTKRGVQPTIVARWWLDEMGALDLKETENG